MPDIEPYMRALEARNAATACPSCGQFAWGHANEYILLHSFGDDHDVIPGNGYPVIALVCDNCGFVRMHFTPILEADR